MEESHQEQFKNTSEDMASSQEQPEGKSRGYSDEEMRAYVEAMEQVRPEKIDFTLDGKKLVFLYEGGSGYPSDPDFMDYGLMKEIYEYFGKDGLKKLSPEDHAKLVKVVRTEIENDIGSIQSSIDQLVNEKLLLLAYDLRDRSLSDLADEYANLRDPNNEFQQELKEYYSKIHSKTASAHFFKKDELEKEYLPKSAEFPPDYKRIAEFLEKELPKGKKNQQDLYWTMVIEYSRVLRAVREQLSAFQKAQELRRMLGKEPLALSPVLEKDKLRDQLHKKLEGLADSLGFTKTDVWLDILATTDGTLIEYSLPNIIIRPYGIKRESVFLFGFADSVGPSGGDTSRWYRFADMIGSQRIYVNKFNWQAKLKGVTKVFAFQKYLAEKYSDIFQPITEEDLETHGIAVDIGVKVKPDQVEGAAAIIRSEIAKFT